MPIIRYFYCVDIRYSITFPSYNSNSTLVLRAKTLNSDNKTKITTEEKLSNLNSNIDFVRKIKEIYPHILPENYPARKCIEKMIRTFNETIPLKNEEMDKILKCPIDLNRLHKPVILPCGHTFSSENIEKHFRYQHDEFPIPFCPMCRHITFTDPLLNYKLDEVLDCLKKTSKVPLFDCNGPHDPQYFTTSLQRAEKCIDEKNYELATQCLETAYSFTNQLNDYEKLPSLFLKMGKTEEAVLVFLLLAKHKLDIKDPQGAIQTLTSCPKTPTTDFCLAHLYLGCNQLSKAWAIAASFDLTDKKQAIHLYKEILKLDPTFWNAYLPLITLLSSPEEKNHFLFMGASYAIDHSNKNLAKELCNQIIIQTADLERLHIIKKMINLDSKYWEGHEYLISITSGDKNRNILAIEATQTAIFHRNFEMAMYFCRKIQTNLTKRAVIALYEQIVEQWKDPIYSEKLEMLKEPISPQSICYGKANWKDFLAIDVGDEPTFPIGIEEILSANCPSSKYGELIGETHTLILIPKSFKIQESNRNWFINYFTSSRETPMTLKNFHKILKEKKNMEFSDVSEQFGNEVFAEQVKSSHWVLFNKDTKAIHPFSLNAANPLLDLLIINSFFNAKQTEE